MPLLHRKVSGLETADFHSPQKHVFYLASLACVLEDWYFDALVEGFMGISDYLALCYILYTIITMNVTKVWLIVIWNQSYSSWAELFLRDEWGECWCVYLPNPPGKNSFQVRNSDAACQRKDENAKVILNKPPNINIDEPTSLFLPQTSYTKPDQKRQTNKGDRV